jgi:hypothetical protein
MMKVKVYSACNMCWTCDPLSLINSRKMAPWCRNMLELARNVLCILSSLSLIYCLSVFCSFSFILPLLYLIPVFYDNVPSVLFT